MLNNIDIKKISLDKGLTVRDIQSYLFQLAEEIEYLFSQQRKDEIKDNSDIFNQILQKISNTNKRLEMPEWAEPEFGNNFKNYSENNNRLTYRKFLNTVEVRGIVTNRETITVSGADESTLIFTLPEGFRPKQNKDVYMLCQASGNGVFLLKIGSDGKAYAERHRDGSVTTSGAFTSITAGQWLPIQITFSTD